MSSQSRFTYNYTGNFRFDNSFIEDLKKLILYYETTGQSPMTSDLTKNNCLSDWIRVDIKVLFTIFRYFEASHCIDHEHTSALDYTFVFFTLPFKPNECKDVYYKKFDGFSMLCFTPTRPASWQYMYINEERNVAIPLEIWSGKNKETCGYKFWVGAFRSVEKHKSFEDHYNCWEVIYSNESCEFYVRKKRNGKFEIEVPPTENYLPSDMTVVVGVGSGVSRNYQWTTKRNPILAPIPLEQTK